MKLTKMALFLKSVKSENMNSAALVVGQVPIEVEVEDIKPELSAVLMDGYGLNSVILTKHDGIKVLIDEFEKSDDSKWLNGEGKVALYDLLMKKLKTENKYFNKKPQKMNAANKRWSNYCDDCIILVALGNVLYQKPIMLLHPNAYEESIASNTDAWIKGAKGKLPTIIDGIETIAVI